MGKPDSKKPIPITSYRDGSLIVELLYDRCKQQSRLVICNVGEISIVDSFKEKDKQTLVPYSPQNDLLRHCIVLFASEPEDYGSKDELLSEIRAYIHRYVDVSERFEMIVSYYILLTWAYDAFNEVPYLRLRGDFGSGKTRFLSVVGSLCYKPIFASGASTVAPIFHMLHSLGGTLILDEADFRFSDMKADMVKILNNGTVKGMPVLRCEKLPNQQFQPKAYTVFGPKIIATRGYYHDEALESRFINEEMGLRKPRKEIPYSLPVEHEREAQDLRNKLLMFRFKNLTRISTQEALSDKTLAPRVNQMFLPLLTLMENEQDRHVLYKMGRAYSKRMKNQKSESAAAQVFEIIAEHIDKKGYTPIPIKELTYRFIERHVDEYDRRVTAKWIGVIVRQKLHLPTQKSHGNFVAMLDDREHIFNLADIYGLQIQRPHVHHEAERGQ